MTRWILLATIVAASATLFTYPRATRKPMGWIALLIGASVFLIRFTQPGRYAFPDGGNLISGLLSLAIAGALLIPALEANAAATLVRRIALAVSPVVLFLGLYATLAEVEEVVVLHTTHISGSPVDLRLWIVDHEDAGWIQMPRSKADEHGLAQTRIEMTRHGERRCASIERFEDAKSTHTVHGLRSEKYFVQRLAIRVGIFGRTPTPTAVVLRVSDCGK